MNRCEECGQEKPATDDDVLAARMDCYRSAFGMFRDLYKRDPQPYEAELTARFLANDKQPNIVDDDGGDDE